MIAADTLHLRTDCVQDYLRLLENARHRSWQEMALGTDLVSDLVLCHPGWFGGLAYVPTGLGLTSFVGTTRVGRCDSTHLWGYECPLQESAMESDHLFPKSLGGPALPTNQVWLCKVHNGWKSSDLSAFPWEDGRPAWLDGQLDRIRSLVVPTDSLTL